MASASQRFGFVGLASFKKNTLHVGGLLFRFAAEAALPCFKRFRPGQIATARNDVAVQSKRRKDRGHKELSHLTSLY